MLSTPLPRKRASAWLIVGFLTKFKSSPRGDVAVVGMHSPCIMLTQSDDKPNPHIDNSAEVGIDRQLCAIQLLLAYAYGPPRAEIETREGLVIQVN